MRGSKAASTVMWTEMIRSELIHDRFSTFYFMNEKFDIINVTLKAELRIIL